MEVAKSDLTAKDAINAAFSYFRDLVEPTATNRIENRLLEGIEFLEDDDQWLVTIGFDIGRKKRTGSDPSIPWFGEATTEPMRETRRVYLRASDGKLVRIES